MESVRYASKWDVWTWVIMALVAACWIVPLCLEDGVLPAVISMVMFVFVLLCFIGTYYKIEGDKLLVYVLFRPTTFPISKIREIRPSKTVLAGPATSLTHRLAITFTDRSVLKSMTPLIISPKDQETFISHIKSLNPDVRYVSEPG